MSLEIRNLTFYYGNKKILHDINIEFYPGEISVIAGPNGSGKTTLIKNIVSQVKTVKNCLFINNKDINSYSITQKSQLISYVPQHNSKDFDFSVYEVVEMGRYPYKKEWNRKKDIMHITEAMHLTDTYIYKDRSITTLSGGELQRVMLARALAGQPEFLILDEPSSNLDIAHNLDMMKLIKKITIELGLTTIIVLHDLNTILHFSDKTALMKQGELCYMGNTEAVLTKDNIKKIYNVDTRFIQEESGIRHIVID